MYMDASQDERLWCLTLMKQVQITKAELYKKWAIGSVSSHWNRLILVYMREKECTRKERIRRRERYVLELVYRTEMTL